MRVDLEMVEMTWDVFNNAWKYIHKIGPLREVIKEGEKRSLGLVEARVIKGDDGKKVGVRQIYVEHAKRRADGVRIGVDRVVELLWLF